MTTPPNGKQGEPGNAPPERPAPGARLAEEMRLLLDALAERAEPLLNRLAAAPTGGSRSDDDQASAQQGERLGQQPTADRATGDRPTGDGVTGDRATGDRSTTDRPTGDWATGDRATSDRATTDRATTDRATTDRATGDRPTTDRPTDRATGDRPTTDRPTTDRPAAEQSPADHTPATCGWCPLCAGIAVLRGERPELAIRAAEHAAGLLSVLRSALAEPTRPAPGNEPEAQPPPPEPARERVQHITVRRRNAGEDDEC
jgi:hypothetical protein